MVQSVGGLLRERFRGCKLVLCGSDRSADGVYPIVGIDEVIEGRTRSDETPWGWRVPIETITNRDSGSSLADRLATREPFRIVFDSVNVLTSMASIRAWPPSHEDGWVRAILARRDRIELWRVTDLAEGDFHSYCAGLTLVQEHPTGCR
jgi:hypothetical protein